MMKKFVNGKYMDMTEEEILAIAEAEKEDLTQPTAEERLEALEMAMLDLLGVIAND